MNKKILYITPHLSTGGAPQYLFKKIELLNEIYNIYVLEYNDHGHFRVQKNKIVSLLGERHKTLGVNKEEIFDFIKYSSPNIIHFVEMPEFFMHDHISKIIYSNDRPYKIFETSHDSSFNPNNKKFFPDKILFCSDNQVKIFKDLNIPSCVIEYPVYDKQVNKKEYAKKLELDPNFKHVLNVGLFTSRKNQGEIFEYARMMEEYPIKFHFVGNMAPNFKDYWEPLINNKPENCIVWGERSDTSNFYSAMDLFLFTSRGNKHDKETNPLVIKEALSHNMNSLIHRLDVYQDKYDDKLTYLSDNFQINKLKILNEVGLEDEIFKINLEHDKSSDIVKLVLDSSKNYDVLKGKMLCVYDLNSGQLIYRTEIFTEHYWIQLNARKRFLSGLDVRIYDLESNYFSNIDDNNHLHRHNIIFNKKIDFENEVDIKINGEKIKLHGVDDDPSAWFTMYEIFLQKVYQNVDVKENDVVVDVGGHYGFFDLYCLDKKVSHVYTLEPSKKTFNVLCKNLRNRENVTKINMALSDKCGEKEFIQVGSSAVHSFYDSFNTHESNNVNKGLKKIEKVKTIDFNSFLKNYDIDRIDVFKIDCEGSEWDFLPTISDDFLKYKVRKIAMEVHDFHENDDKEESKKRSVDLIERLKKCNFKVDYDPQVLQGECGNLIAKRIPKMKIVHMLVDVNGNREKESIKQLKAFSEYSGFEYIQMINELYTELPPKDTCARPEVVQMEPGEYKLAPAHYGNFLAHKTAIETYLNDDCDAIIFCECDAILIESHEKVYRTILDRFDDMRYNNMKFMNMAKRIENMHHTELNQFLGKTSRMSEAHFYLIPTNEREFFVNQLNNTGWDTYDLWLNNNVIWHGLGCILKEPLSIQCSGDSYLDKKYKDGTTGLNDNKIKELTQKNKKKSFHKSVICTNEDKTRINLHITDSYEKFHDKLICVYEIDTGLLIHRTNVISSMMWTQPYCDPNSINGITVKIFDAPKNYFSSINDENLIDENHLLFEKSFRFDKPNVDVKILGKNKKFYGIPDDPSAWYTLYENLIVGVYDKLKIEKDDVVVDIGGHYGFFAMYALNKGASKIHSIEPTKTTFDILNKNLKEYENAKTYNLAISSDDTDREIIAIGSSSCNSFHENSNNNLDNKETQGIRKKQIVKCSTFEQFMKNNNIEKIDALKMDCEGAEWDLLPTISDDIFKNKIRKICMEAHPDGVGQEGLKVNASNFVKRLKNLGWNVEISSQVIEHGKLGTLFAYNENKK